MIYRILRQLLKLIFAIYFRKIYFIDAHHLPKNGPVILACNHPSAFLEAFLLSAFLPRQLYYLTRGDFFKSRFAKWFLRQTYQIPIYRSRDGFENLRSNIDTFEQCYVRLSQGNVILMFPEARTFLEKRLRSIQRGAARIGLGTIERHPDVSPVIVPVGVTFTEPRKPSGNVFVKFAKPIQLSSFMEQYRSVPHEAIRDVTALLETIMRTLIVDMKNKERESVYDALSGIGDGRPVLFPVVSNAPGVFQKQLLLSAAINRLSEGEFQKLLESIEKSGSHGETWQAGVQEQHGVSGISPGVIFYLIGRMLNLPGRMLMQWILNKFVVETFKGPVNAMIGFFVHGLYYVLILIVLYAQAGATGLCLGILLAMIGYFSVANSHLREDLTRLKWKIYPKKVKRQIMQDLGPVRDLIATVRDQANS